MLPTSSAAATTCEDLITIGHRGNGEGADENTIPHMNEAVLNGADVIEFDVRYTRNAVPVVMHDADTRRTTGTAGLVSRMSLRQFRALRVQPGGHRPPTFAAVVSTMTQLGVGLQVHLKVSPTTEQLHLMKDQLLLAGFTADTVQFNSGNLRLLRRVERQIGFPTGYTYVGRATQSRLTGVSDMGVDVAVLARRHVTPTWVQYAAERDLEIGARARSISTTWAVSNGIRRLVIDDVFRRC